MRRNSEFPARQDMQIKFQNLNYIATVVAHHAESQVLLVMFTFVKSCIMLERMECNDDITLRRAVALDVLTLKLETGFELLRNILNTP